MSGTSANILIVCDARNPSNLPVRLLGQAGYSIELQSPREAQRKIGWLRYDLVVIDWSGLALCRSLRQAGSSTPVLVLTGSGFVGDKLEAFASGVDDYLTIPYHSEELMARIGAMLRRHDIVRAGDLMLNLREHVAFWSARRLALTVREFKLLHLLVRNAGRPLTREQILSSIGEIRSTARSNVIDVHVRNLRLKLGPGAVQLRSVRGSGYCYQLASDNPRPAATRQSPGGRQGTNVIRASRTGAARDTSPSRGAARGGIGPQKAAAGAR